MRIAWPAIEDETPPEGAEVVLVTGYISYRISRLVRTTPSFRLRIWLSPGAYRAAVLGSTLVIHRRTPTPGREYHGPHAD